MRPEVAYILLQLAIGAYILLRPYVYSMGESESSVRKPMGE